MKKIVSLGIVSILALGLTGCNWFQSSAPAEEQPAVTKQPAVTEEPTVTSDSTKTVSGNYYATSLGGGESLFFDPSDSSLLSDNATFFNFSNNNEAYNLLDISDYPKENCTDFYGSATIEIKDLKQLDGVYGKVWQTELVSVQKTSEPTCEVYQS
jgi:hypothetical protein